MVGLATCDVQEVVAPPFPKWYVEAPLGGALPEKSEILMDEVRTALLDFPDPAAITELVFGCVQVHVRGEADRVPLMHWLVDKGFGLGVCKNLTPETYPADYSEPSNHIVVGGRS